MYTKTIVASLALAGAAVAGAQVKPTLLYGTSTSVVSDAPFALASTQPPSGKTRSQFVIAAEKDAAANLRVLAWQDTASALTAISHYGTLVIDGGLAGFAVTGLDAEHVVTAAIDAKGALFIDTWTVATSGVTLEHAYRTGTGKAGKTVAIARAGTTRVVVAFATPNGTLDVEAYSIASNGAATPESALGTGPSVTQVAIAAVDPNLMITSSSDGAGTLYVNTWAVNSGGVTASNEAVFSGTVNTTPQAVAVGAGGTSVNGTLVHSAFTPFISPDDQFNVYYWSVSTSGGLTQQTTPTPTIQGDFFQVAAAMLPSNIPMSSYSGGTGDNSLFVEWWTGFSYTDPNGAQFSPSPANVSSIASVSEGNNTAVTGEKSDFFVSAVADEQLNPSPNGTLYLEVFSVPDSNPNL